MSAIEVVTGGFVVLLGACVGSFLNVVVHRLATWEPPANAPWWRQPWLVLRHLSDPPSHCPNCRHRLAWYDNVPILGWPLLGGKCRYCKTPISPRYPLVELFTALLFGGCYFAFFGLGLGPAVVEEVARTAVMPATTATTTLADVGVAAGWPVLVVALWLLAALLAASLIDAEHFIIPLSLPWSAAVVGLVVHPLFAADPDLPGNLVASPTWATAGLAGLAGLGVSFALLRLGVLPLSFAEDAPPIGAVAVEAEPEGAADEWPPGRIRREMHKEVLFLALPIAGVAAGAWLAPTTLPLWLAALGGAILGGLVGGFVVWAARILGSYLFGREAMGLGDVHLMWGVGCCLGGGPAAVAFFLAPFFGLPLAGVVYLVRGQRHLPFGPYLSIGGAVALLAYPPIAAYLGPGLDGLAAVMGF